MTFIFISFIAGILTVLAPCILPVLPVIIGGSVSAGENKRKAYVIILALIISVVLFTLLLKFSTAFVMVPPMVWTAISGTILIFFALTMIFPALWERLPFVSKLSIGSNKLLGEGYQKKTIWGDVIIGAALGPVFSSCSPTYFIILATVLPKSFAAGLIDLLLYAAGLGLALLAISLLGQKLVDRLGVLANPNGWFKKTLGVLFLLVGIFVFSGKDKDVQAFVLSHVFDVTKFEQKILQNSSTDAQTSTTDSVGLSVEEKAKLFEKYHEIEQPGGYVNTNDVPFTIGQYVGKKVILLDFMTYSCINCQRTFPYLKTWYDKYEDKGLIIIGIHTPEFAFEHEKKNVAEAMKSFGLTFPVVLDNEYGTWNAYGNHYWPRKYLIDIDGFVVYDHIGEGADDIIEQKIVELLNERATRTGDPQISFDGVMPVADALADDRSPETYLGGARGELQYNPETTCTTSVCDFNPNDTPPENHFSLKGTWQQSGEYVELEKAPGSIFYNFSAKKVYLVAEGDKPIKAEIYLDGKSILPADAGEDVTNGMVTFSESRLYTLVNLQTEGEHTLEIRVQDSGLRAYAFTFG